MTNVTYAYFKSKDEEQAFLMTGNDIGFTKWDNELKEALLRAPITFRQYKIFDAIHRRTIGWGKDFDRITDFQISEMTGIHRTHINKVKLEMIKLKMLLMRGDKIGVNQHFQDWNFPSNVAESATVIDKKENTCKSSSYNESVAKSSTAHQNSYSVAKSVTRGVAKPATEKCSRTSYIQKKEKESKENIYKPPIVPRAKKSKSFDPSSAELPTWLPKPTWDSWVQYRKEINKPIKSQQTVIQAIKLLGKCRDNGHQPEEIINASIANGWQGLFEPQQAARTQHAKAHSVADSFADKDYGEPQLPDWARECLAREGL